MSLSSWQQAFRSSCFSRWNFSWSVISGRRISRQSAGTAPEHTHSQRRSAPAADDRLQKTQDVDTCSFHTAEIIKLINVHEFIKLTVEKAKQYYTRQTEHRLKKTKNPNQTTQWPDTTANYSVCHQHESSDLIGQTGLTVSKTVHNTVLCPLPNTSPPRCPSR